ncbi:MAG TPA: glycogen synthase [Dehalococcoidia bacterium]|nr:glycogen synthase [Dehalococcoidia bacterium]
MSLRILFVAAEATPFSKVGGLADVAGSLPQALAARGHDVRLVTPKHHANEPGNPHREITLPFRGTDCTLRIDQVDLANSAKALVIGDDNYFPRQAVYGEPDDLDRYLFFSQAALELPRKLDWRPDIIHLNDWHTGPIAYALRNYGWNDEFYRHAASVFTIHNLRYRGPDNFVDLIGPAIFYADAVTTVSPTYAREILTPELGEGLHELLQTRRGSLYGVLNGIDYDEFNPATDERIEASFDADSLNKRPANRSALRRRLGLEDSEKPLVAMVTRLSEQKGIDIALEALTQTVGDGQVQTAILGAGDRTYEEAAAALAAAHPTNATVTIGFDATLAQQLYAGSDFFLMPSRFEPCGLGQMIAMRYGSIPIVRRTGGLADTVPDAADDGLGFVFEEYSSAAVSSTLERAVTAFRQSASFRDLQLRAMSADFSWGASAAAYEGIYEETLNSRSKRG